MRPALAGLRYISWFSGIGGFDLALDRTGWRRVGACEVDPFARAVHTVRLGLTDWFPEDIANVNPETIPGADLWCGGPPCQGFSTAGKRLGLTDPRSNLFLRLLRLVANAASPPRWLLLENVDHLLRNHDGEDFGVLLGALADGGYPHAAWRVLDAQRFGVAQKRWRVFLLARRSGALGGCPVEVLLEPESEAGDRAAGRPPWTLAAAGAGIGAARGARTAGIVGTILCGSGIDVAAACAGHIVRTVTAGPSGDETANPVRVYRKARHPYEAGTLVAAYTITPESGQGTDLVAIPAEIATGLNRTGLGRSTDRGTRIVQEERVRRLTPLELERLFGFPDGWTCLCGLAARSGRYRSIDCECPDSPRYRSLGNAVVVPVIEWVARRLADALS